MLDKLLLQSINDVPFPQAQLVIHQPTIKEIAYIGEKAFFLGCNFLNFSKEKFLSAEDNSNLSNKTNFEVLMSIIKNSQGSKEMKLSVHYLLLVLNLIFPSYEISFGDNNIILIDNQAEKHFIDNKNYETFKTLVCEIFCLNKASEENNDYNPSGDLARQLAEKMKKGREKAAAAKGEDQKDISILNRYISILSVGEKKDKNELMNYTIYQLFDEFQRFNLKQDYDIYFKLKIAGAKDVKEVDNWMKEIHL